MKGNFHARFWIGGEESDLLADHTEYNAKELYQGIQIDQASVMLLEPLRELPIARGATENSIEAVRPGGVP